MSESIRVLAESELPHTGKYNQSKYTPHMTAALKNPGMYVELPVMVSNPHSWAGGMRKIFSRRGLAVVVRANRVFLTKPAESAPVPA